MSFLDLSKIEEDMAFSSKLVAHPQDNLPEPCQPITGLEMCDRTHTVQMYRSPSGRLWDLKGLLLSVCNYSYILKLLHLFTSNKNVECKPGLRPSLMSILFVNN